MRLPAVGVVVGEACGRFLKSGGALEVGDGLLPEPTVVKRDSELDVGFGSLTVEQNGLHQGAAAFFELFDPRKAVRKAELSPVFFPGQIRNQQVFLVDGNGLGKVAVVFKLVGHVEEVAWASVAVFFDTGLEDLQVAAHLGSPLLGKGTVLNHNFWSFEGAAIRDSDAFVDGVLPAQSGRATEKPLAQGAERADSVWRKGDLVVEKNSIERLSIAWVAELVFEGEQPLLIDSTTAGLIRDFQKDKALAAPICTELDSKLRRFITKLAKETGLDKKYDAQSLSPHSFRHAYATHLYQHGMDVSTIKRLLGHAKLEDTAIYVKSEMPQWRAAYDRCSLLK